MLPRLICFDADARCRVAAADAMPFSLQMFYAAVCHVRRRCMMIRADFRFDVFRCASLCRFLPAQRFAASADAAVTVCCRRDYALLRCRDCRRRYAISRLMLPRRAPRLRFFHHFMASLLCCASYYARYRCLSPIMLFPRARHPPLPPDVAAAADAASSALPAIQRISRRFLLDNAAFFAAVDCCAIRAVSRC